MPKTQLVHTTMAHLRDWTSICKLKACPLCGCLNVAENEECFACRWQGGFETDIRLIQLRVAELALARPELRLLWQVEAPRGKWFRNAFRGFCDWVYRVFLRRNVDMSV